MFSKRVYASLLQLPDVRSIFGAENEHFGQKLKRSLAEGEFRSAKPIPGGGVRGETVSSVPTPWI
jgi:hypothetical protein